MYAIVEIAGKQFRVSKDMKLKVPYLKGDTGKKMDFDRVLMMEDDKGNVSIGQPTVKDTNVTATLIEHGREKKIIVFKKKRRKGYQKKNGHRQDFSLIEINAIGAAKKAKPAEKVTRDKPAVPKTAAKTTKSAPAKKAPAAKKTTAEKPKTAAKTSTAKKAPAAKKTVKKETTAKKEVKEEKDGS